MRTIEQKEKDFFRFCSQPSRSKMFSAKSSNNVLSKVDGDNGGNSGSSSLPAVSLGPTFSQFSLWEEL